MTTVTISTIRSPALGSAAKRVPDADPYCGSSPFARGGVSGRSNPSTSVDANPVRAA